MFPTSQPQVMQGDPKNQIDSVTDSSSLYSEQSAQIENAMILRVESVSGIHLKVQCITAYQYLYMCVANNRMSSVPMQRFLLLRFLLRWVNVGIWIFFLVMVWQASFYVQHEKLNLYLATALSASLLLVVCIALAGLVRGMRRATKTHQNWCATSCVALYLQHVCYGLMAMQS